jgi:tetratricopeptide (TPR) repeat protein
MMGRLVRQILLGASTAGLEIAGAAALGPAWPVLRGALAPVLDRLAEKLGGADPVGSQEDANRAADAFEQDPRLEELLRSNLADALQPVLAGQQSLDAGLQTLCQLVMENSQALEEINQSVGSIEAQLEAGVKLSDDTVERLAEATARRTAVTLEVKGFAREEAEAAEADTVLPEAWVTREDLADEVNRVQVEAVVQIEDGRLADAMESLRSARALLAQALAQTPSDIRLRLLQGYLLKTLAQANISAGDEVAAAQYLLRAETMFRLIVRDLPADDTTTGEIASALNGFANILAERGGHAEAVPIYWEAVRLLPSYGYAWHDLFLSLVALAAEGDLRSDDLDQAWEGLAAAAPGYPGLEPARLEDLRAYYDRYRQEPDGVSADPDEPS